MKKLISIAGSVALLISSAMPAIAANNCSNETTGPLSTNYCTVTNSSTVTVNNINDAKIINNVSAKVNTGGNSASYNTLGGAITTGQASLNASVGNVANINTTTVTGGPSASDNTGSNGITGPESDNRVTITNTRVVDVTNSNTALVTNNVDARVNSGFNKADFNTGPASVTTGNSNLDLAVATHVNDNATGISAGAGGTGGNTADNSTTGPLSTNYVDMFNTSLVTVNNINDMMVANNVKARTNTGRNSASFNTLGGAIDTGNAGAEVGINTEGNINTTTIQQALGGFVNDAGNGVTGPLSDNRTQLLNNQNIVVENWNNKCKSHNASSLGDYECDPRDLGVVNNDDDRANTGDNKSDFNTGGGATLTGLADLYKSIVTHINDSLTLINQ